MEPGNWIAIGAVGVAIGSNVTTLYFGNRRLKFDAEQGRERLDHERRLEDRRVAGAILDEAAETLRIVDQNLLPIRVGMRRAPERFPAGSAAEEAFAELEGALGDITHMHDRLRFRFWGGPVPLSFERCYEDAAEIWSNLNLILLEDFDSVETEEARVAVRKECRERAEAVEEAIARFGQNSQDFRDAAYEVIGIRR